MAEEVEAKIKPWETEASAASLKKYKNAMDEGEKARALFYSGLNSFDPHTQPTNRTAWAERLGKLSEDKDKANVEAEAARIEALNTMQNCEFKLSGVVLKEFDISDLEDNICVPELYAELCKVAFDGCCDFEIVADFRIKVTYSKEEL